MKQFVLRNTLYLLTAFGIGVAVYLTMNWSTMPVLQRMVGLIFIVLTLHEWEEFRFPGGFPEMAMSNLHFFLSNLDAAKLVVAVCILYMAFVPLFFPHVAWLSIAPMLLGVLEQFGHLGVIKLFKLRRFYSPGLVTAVLMLPISIYSIIYVVQNNLMQPVSWLFSILYVVIGFVIAQITVLNINGMKYADFMKKVRSVLLTKQT